jgi:hypothetical protein
MKCDQKKWQNCMFWKRLGTFVRLNLVRLQKTPAGAPDGSLESPCHGQCGCSGYIAFLCSGKKYFSVYMHVRHMMEAARFEVIATS